MPIYEYDCPLCGLFEVIQGSSDKPLKAKPDCPEKNCPKKAHKVISQSAFHLKGSGWYKTDYAPSGTASSSSAKVKKGEGASESKPAESKTPESKSSDNAKASDNSSKGTD